jgi:hypothetical protein
MAGRPSDFNVEKVEKALWYLDNFAQCDDVIPSVEGLADYLQVCKKTVLNWCEPPANTDELPEDRKLFLHTLNRIKARQAKITLSGGLNKVFDASISKLILHNHGYSDKQQIDLESPKGTMSPKEIDDKELARRAAFMIQGLLNK